MNRHKWGIIALEENVFSCSRFICIPFCHTTDDPEEIAFNEAFCLCRQPIEITFGRLKVGKISEDSLDWISSHSTSVKIQIMGGKVCLWCKFKTLLCFRNFVNKARNFLLLHFKQTFRP